MCQKMKVFLCINLQMYPIKAVILDNLTNFLPYLSHSLYESSIKIAVFCRILTNDDLRVSSYNREYCN